VRGTAYCDGGLAVLSGPSRVGTDVGHQLHDDDAERRLIPSSAHREARRAPPENMLNSSGCSPPVFEELGQLVRVEAGGTRNVRTMPVNHERKQQERHAATQGPNLPLCASCSDGCHSVRVRGSARVQVKIDTSQLRPPSLRSPIAAFVSARGFRLYLEGDLGRQFHLTTLKFFFFFFQP